MLAGSSSHALPAARASSPSNAPNNEKSNEKNNEKGQEMAGQRSRACRRCGSADHHYSTAKLCPKHPNFDPVKMGAKTNRNADDPDDLPNDSGRRSACSGGPPGPPKTGGSKQVPCPHGRQKSKCKSAPELRAPASSAAPLIAPDGFLLSCRPCRCRHSLAERHRARDHQKIKNTAGLQSGFWQPGAGDGAGPIAHRHDVIIVQR